MSYYQQPAGDYRTYGYAGDPGWLSSIWRGIKKVAPTLIGAALGGPLGGVVAGMAGGGMKPSPGIMQLAPPPRGQFPAGMVGGSVTMPGGTSISLAGQLPVSHAALGAHAPSGYHLDKATRSRWVRNRRMNIANPRALRRAMRRVQGFEKMAKRTISFTRRVKMKK